MEEKESKNVTKSHYKNRNRLSFVSSVHPIQVYFCFYSAFLLRFCFLSLSTNHILSFHLHYFKSCNRFVPFSLNFLQPLTKVFCVTKALDNKNPF